MEKDNWNTIADCILDENPKHISLDFWRTIGFSNPKFKYSRSKLLTNYSDKHDIELIDDVFYNVGKEYNKDMERHDAILPPHKLYEKVFSHLQVPKGEYKLLSKEIAKYFISYPPIICSEFLAFLDKINTDKYSFSITSNTAFISGDLISLSLVNNGCSNIFNFMIFSDIVKSAKPHKCIFHMLYNKAQMINGNIEKNQVVHIGDNEVTDYIGAKDFGLSALKLG
jgi:putative hydrolase of the HAD superfamily